MKGRTLRQLQRSFKEVIKGKEKVKPLSTAVKTTNGFRSTDRIAIYQRAFRLRMQEALSEDFPTVLKFLGRKEFNRLIPKYFLDHPSRFANLAEVGKNFPLFLKKQPIFHNGLSEVARFEWLKLLSELSEEDDKFDFASLAFLSPKQQSRVTLKLQRSVYLFQSSWDVVGSKKEIPKKKVRLMIFQHDGEVQWERLSQSEWKILTNLSAGLSVERLAALLLKERVNQRKARQWFAHWSEIGILKQV